MELDYLVLSFLFQTCRSPEGSFAFCASLVAKIKQVDHN